MFPPTDISSIITVFQSVFRLGMSSYQVLHIFYYALERRKNVFFHNWQKLVSKSDFNAACKFSTDFKC